MAVQYQLQDYLFSGQLPNQTEVLQKITNLLSFSQTIVKLLQQVEVQLLFVCSYAHHALILCRTMTERNDALNSVLRNTGSYMGFCFVEQTTLQV